ncbi:MAG: endonuclease/exonuclease/phosphatase family protein, partial [Chloroflexota bacterium]
VHWLLLPAFLLIPIGLARRRWGTLALLLMCSTAFIVLFGGLFIPIFPDRDICDDQQFSTLRVMTYNISHGLAFPDRIVEVMETSGAEVIAIQELPDGMVPTIQEELGDLYPYQVFFGGGFSGIGLISRYPILEEEPFLLEGPRPYLMADLKVGSDIVTVIAAHPPVMIGPGGGSAPGAADMQTLAEMAVGEGRTIIMGDFNFTDQNQDYRVLARAGLIDAHRAAGWGFGSTYPRRGWTGGFRLPLVRIDHVFLAGEIYPQRVWVGRDGGSDHLPVLAILAW